MTAPHLPRHPLRVINIGLAIFVEQLEADGVAVVHVDWRPPAGGPEIVPLLMALVDEVEKVDNPESLNIG